MDLFSFRHPPSLSVWSSATVSRGDFQRGLTGGRQSGDRGCRQADDLCSGRMAAALLAFGNLGSRVSSMRRSEWIRPTWCPPVVVALGPACHIPRHPWWRRSHGLLCSARLCAGTPHCPLRPPMGDPGGEVPAGRGVEGDQFSFAGIPQWTGSRNALSGRKCQRPHEQLGRPASLGECHRPG